MGDKGGTKALVTSKNLSESRAILDSVDILVTLNMTDNEKKLGKDDGVVEQRLYIDKNRNGASGEIINFTIDYNTMTVSEGKKDRR